MTSLLQSGEGLVPEEGWGLKSVLKGVLEFVVDDGMQAHMQLEKKGIKLDFSKAGIQPTVLAQFLKSLMNLDGAQEPIVQSGGIYGVSSDFNNLNAKVLIFQLKHSPYFMALDQNDKTRALEMFRLILENHDLRNRNPIHPSVIDSCLISTLLNFPKHLFGMPYACYASDANESLSLTLYGYLQRAREQNGLDKGSLLVVGTDVAQNVRYIAERLTLEIIQTAKLPLQASNDVVAVMIDLDNPDLRSVVEWSETHGLGCHIHVTSDQWRNIFIDNKEPVHYTFPAGVTSVSVDAAPMLETGFSLYRDFEIRDYHLDIPRKWQAVYISPNEGGSNNARGLFQDLCTCLLGWTSMRALASSLPRANELIEPLLQVSKYYPKEIDLSQKSIDESLDWAYEMSLKAPGISKEGLEVDLVRFQLEFLGGQDQELDAMTTGGGTKSINLAFQSVLSRERHHGNHGPYKVVTGNPHLAVERAEKRFGFELVRTEDQGAISIEGLKKAIQDPQVIAVYAQTLSYTDGITDPLQKVFDALEERNKKFPDLRPIYFINDSCLAFSVLLHNDGKNCSESLRVLDMAKGKITPAIVMNDPHKHLGTDKGLSTIVGTSGALKHLNGHIRIGKQPNKNDLIRAIANLRAVGRNGYFDLYHGLGDKVADVIEKIEAQGVNVMHKQNRAKGSTVIAVEDPSGYSAKQLKKRGHAVMPLFKFRPEQPELAQTGWQLSFTPHSLRNFRIGKSALDCFVEDFIEVQNQYKKNKILLNVQYHFGQNSFLAHLVSGNINPYLFGLLLQPGFRREFACTMIRRFVTGSLDYGATKAKPELTVYSHMVMSTEAYLRRMKAALLILVGLVLMRKLRKRML